MNLQEAVQRTITEREEWLAEAKDAAEKLQGFPEIVGISADGATVDTDCTGALRIRLHYFGDEADEQARLAQKVFEAMGAEFAEPKHFHGGLFSSRASIQKDSTELEVDIIGYGLPLGCELVYKKRMRTVAEIICEKTGKPIKS